MAVSPPILGLIRSPSFSCWREEIDCPNLTMLHALKKCEFEVNIYIYIFIIIIHLVYICE